MHPSTRRPTPGMHHNSTKLKKNKSFLPCENSSRFRSRRCFFAPALFCFLLFRNLLFQSSPRAKPRSLHIHHPLSPAPPVVNIADSRAGAQIQSPPRVQFTSTPQRNVPGRALLATLLRKVFAPPLRRSGALGGVVNSHCVCARSYVTSLCARTCLQRSRFRDPEARPCIMNQQLQKQHRTYPHPHM